MKKHKDDGEIQMVNKLKSDIQVLNDNKPIVSYNHNVDYYIKKSKSNKKLYNRLSNTVLILSSSIPVIVVWQSTIQKADLFDLAIAFVSAAVLVLTGIKSHYNYEKNWYRCRKTAIAIENEGIKFVNKTTPYNVPSIAEAVTLLTDRVNSIVANETGDWALDMSTQGGR